MKTKTRDGLYTAVSVAILFVLLLFMYKCLIFPMPSFISNRLSVITGIPTYVLLALIDLVFKMGFVITIRAFLLPSFTRERKVARLYIFFVITLLLFFVSEVLIKGSLIPGFHEMHLLGHIPLGLISLILYILIASVLIINYLIRQWIQDEKQKRELIKSQLTNELNFLKAQVNPHFIFNSLNTLFSISQKYKAPELETGILKLADMLRYSLYENTSNTVPLVKEIKYINDYIGLYKLRYPGDELAVAFTVTGSIDNVSISPMLFLPFVENAFKYGVTIKKSSRIEIQIDAKGNEIYFKCINDIVRSNTDDITADKGLGLVNVKRRLALLYPDQYELKIEAINEKFIVTLHIMF